MPVTHGVTGSSPVRTAKKSLEVDDFKALFLSAHFLAQHDAYGMPTFLLHGQPGSSAPAYDGLADKEANAYTDSDAI